VSRPRRGRVAELTDDDLADLIGRELLKRRRRTRRAQLVDAVLAEAAIVLDSMLVVDGECL
jgi:hypothetical protein